MNANSREGSWMGTWLILLALENKVAPGQTGVTKCSEIPRDAAASFSMIDSWRKCAVFFHSLLPGYKVMLGLLLQAWESKVWIPL